MDAEDRIVVIASVIAALAVVVLVLFGPAV